LVRVISDVFANHAFAGQFHPYAHAGVDVGTDAYAEVAGTQRHQLVEGLARRALELHHELGCRYRQHLAGADVDRHTGPPP
jgi:hypothetical protein